MFKGETRSDPNVCSNRTDRFTKSPTQSCTATLVHAFLNTARPIVSHQRTMRLEDERWHQSASVSMSIHATLCLSRAKTGSRNIGWLYLIPSSWHDDYDNDKLRYVHLALESSQQHTRYVGRCCRRCRTWRSNPNFVSFIALFMVY